MDINLKLSRLIIFIFACTSLVSCNKDTSWGMVFDAAGFEDSTKIFANCEFEIEVRIYQDNVQKVITSLPFNKSATSTRFNMNGLDPSKKVRIRAIVTRVDGDCPPLKVGQIYYFPSRMGWAMLTPLKGETYEAKFSSYGIKIFPGKVL